MKVFRFNAAPGKKRVLQIFGRVVFRLTGVDLLNIIKAVRKRRQVIALAIVLQEMHIVGHSITDDGGIRILKKRLEKFIKIREGRQIGKDRGRIGHHFFGDIPIKAVARIDQHIFFFVENFKIFIGHYITKTENFGRIAIAISTLNIKKQVFLHADSLSVQKIHNVKPQHRQKAREQNPMPHIGMVTESLFHQFRGNMNIGRLGRGTGMTHE